MTVIVIIQAPGGATYLSTHDDWKSALQYVDTYAAGDPIAVATIATHNDQEEN